MANREAPCSRPDTAMDMGPSIKRKAFTLILEHTRAPVIAVNYCSS